MNFIILWGWGRIILYLLSFHTCRSSTWYDLLNWSPFNPSSMCWQHPKQIVLWVAIMPTAAPPTINQEAKTPMEWCRRNLCLPPPQSHGRPQIRPRGIDLSLLSYCRPIIQTLSFVPLLIVWINDRRAMSVYVPCYFRLHSLLHLSVQTHTPFFWPCCLGSYQACLPFAC